MMDTKQFAKMVVDLHEIKRSMKWQFWRGWGIATIVYWGFEVIERYF